jgi:hypothetical protein
MTYRKFDFAGDAPKGYMMNFEGEVMSNDLGRFNFKKNFMRMHKFAVSGGASEHHDFMKRRRKKRRMLQSLPPVIAPAQSAFAMPPLVAPVDSVSALPPMVSPVQTLSGDGEVLPTGYAGFAEWMRRVHPDVYEKAMSSPTLSGIGATDAAPADVTANPKPGLIDSLIAAGQKMLPLYYQQQEFKAQLDRAKQGLPPLNLPSYTGDTGYKVGLTSSTQNTMLMVAGLGLGGLLLYKLLGKR